MKVQFARRGWEDYLTWQRDRQMLKRVNTLIEDIRRNDHEGIGKPEQLRGNWSGFWSRRIDQEHRLVYRIVDDTVQIAHAATTMSDFVRPSRVRPRSGINRAWCRLPARRSEVTDELVEQAFLM